MKRDCIVIDVHHGSTSESWLTVYKDGSVEYHIENDGWRYVNHGPEANDKWLTPEEVVALGRSGSYPPSDDRPFTERVAEAVGKLNSELYRRIESADGHVKYDLVGIAHKPMPPSLLGVIRCDACDETWPCEVERKRLTIRDQHEQISRLQMSLYRAEKQSAR